MSNLAWSDFPMDSADLQVEAVIPLHVLCLTSAGMDPSREGSENILDQFRNFKNAKDGIKISEDNRA